MHTVTSFDSASVGPQEINAVMADYFALERARIYRRLFVTRFGILALIFGTIGLGLHWLPPFASWFSVGLCAIAPTCAWIAELRCSSRMSPKRTASVEPPGQSASSLTLFTWAFREN